MRTYVDQFHLLPTPLFYLMLSYATQTSKMWIGLHFVSCESVSEVEFIYLCSFKKNGSTISRTAHMFACKLLLSHLRCFQYSLFLTLTKYRHNLDFKMLSILFKISRNDAIEIFQYFAQRFLSKNGTDSAFSIFQTPVI